MSEIEYKPDTDPSPAAKKAWEGLDFLEFSAVGIGATLGAAASTAIPPEMAAKAGAELSKVLADAPRVIAGILSNAETIRLAAQLVVILVGAKLTHSGYLSVGRAVGFYKEKPKSHT